MKKLCSFRCSQKGCQMESTYKKWGRNWNDERRLTLLRSAYSLLRHQPVSSAYHAVQWKEKWTDISNDWFLQFETRLDTVLYRFGWVNSIQEARQLISHQLILVNDRVVSSKKFQLNTSHVISIRDEKTKKRIAKTIQLRLQALNQLEVEKRQDWLVPNYLYVNYNLLLGNVLYLPSREEIPFPCQPVEEMLLAMDAYK